MKKIILIILIALSLTLLIILGWSLISKDSSKVANTILGNLPFGSGEGVDIPFSDREDEDILPLVDESGAPVAKLFQLSKTPVAGYIALGRGSSTFVRYTDRATGHIYDINPLTLEKIKISNNTLPKIYEAHFRADGNAVLYRSIEPDEETVSNTTLLLTPPRQSSSTSTPINTLYDVSASILRGEIGDVIVQGNSLIYTLVDSSALVSSNFDGSGLRTLFSTPFTEWRLVKNGASTMLYTKADSTVAGSAYSLSSGGLNKILGPNPGLTVLPNVSGTRLLYSYRDGSSHRTFSRDNSSGEESEIYPQTLVEKCVWSDPYRDVFFCGMPEGGLGPNEPENWYLGKTHFSDSVWRIDLARELATVIVEPKKVYDVDLDISGPQLTPNEDYLLFINKTDLSLWALKLEE